MLKNLWNKFFRNETEHTQNSIVTGRSIPATRHHYFQPELPLW